MPYVYGTGKTDLDPSHSLPERLGHKTFYAIPYEYLDGPFKGDTDARFLSLGLAQYNHGISLKVLRHTGTKWSRQSEELPPHRPVDLTILLASVLCSSGNEITYRAGTFHGQVEDLKITSEDRTRPEIQAFHEASKQGSEFLKERLRVLRDILNDATKNGCL